MILQALVKHYEDLLARGDVSRPGWGPAKVSFVLYLNGSGQITQTASVKQEPAPGKKPLPREMEVPAPVKRSSGIAANFLCDNSAYMLGVDAKGKPQRAKDCFQACKELHERLLSGVDSPAAAALLAFFRTWEPDQALEHPALQENLEEILGRANLVFRCNGAFLQDDPAIRNAWQAHYDQTGDAPRMTCLVTGKLAPVAQLHPSIKGIQGAQSSGASLVSFNAPSFCSYGRDGEQGLNAPTSQYAAFAYGTALNHLIASREYVSYIGDTIVLCWADGAQPQYAGLFGIALSGTQTHYSETDLQKMVKTLASGTPVEYDETLLDPNRGFYVLGIAPNAARLSVRFFLRNSFGTMLRNIQRHQQRLEIERPAYDTAGTLPLWRLLNETVNQNSRDKSPSPILAGELLRAILNDTCYPATLLNGVVLRIRADHEITRGRAAILKAYYLKHPNPSVPKEVLTVSLNPDSTNVPYTLGRLFSVLEDIQSAANPDINATIKDKYFNAASSTPARIFPILINLAQKHLRKLDAGRNIHYNKQLIQLLSRLEDSYPPRLTLPEQGSFQLGYYHQTQARYQRKEKEEN